MTTLDPSSDAPALSFGPYRLVGPRGPLLWNDQELKLPLKVLAVLWELVRQAGEIVTKSALLAR